MNTHRSTFQIKTVTFNLSLAEGVDITAVQGKKYRLTLPMNSLVFDNTGGQSAWFYAVLPVQLGTGSTPVPAGIYVDDVGVHEFLGSDEGDPRKSIVSRLVYEISFASDAETFDTLPLVVKGFAVATNAPSSFSLPSFTPTVDPEIEASDISGGTLPQGIGFENIPGGSISDASTLNGQPASYYLNTTTVLGDLADVDATGAVEGYVLTSNGSGWVAAESQGGSGGGSSTLAGLSDVDVTGAGSGQVLGFNGSEWVNVDQSGGGAELEANQFKTIRFNNAPAAMEFGFTIGDGTDPVILTGGMDAAAIKTAIEVSDDTDGFTADVYGSTTTSTGTDGVLLHTGMFIVAMRGTAPFPAWTAVQNSEVQSFIVEEGDSGNYTLNSGANFTLGATESTLQSNQRALSGDYADVVIAGESQAGTIPDVTISGANSEGVVNGTYVYAGLSGGAPSFSKGSWSIKWNSGASRWEVVHVDTTVRYANSGGSIAGWAGAWTDQVGTGDNISVTPLSPETASVAEFNSYFPYSVGDVTNPSATGTDAVASTIHQGGSTSSIVTANSSTMEEVLISGLELPVSTAPTGAYTPANSGHWNTPPTTITQALDMLASAFNGAWGPV